MPGNHCTADRDKGQRCTSATPGEDPLPTPAIDAGTKSGVGDDHERLVEHRLGGPAEDDQCEADSEEDRPAPTSIPDDVHTANSMKGRDSESLGHVDMVDLAQHDA